MAHQSPMISSPLKQTNEIDWITPLKDYIRENYGDDPERYSEECNMLNRLRQDMRGAGKDSASGRDLLYRYYGQLELLDLRFPVDENHIKIQFTWFDAFTHKPTSQYSLAYEKASIIFNISAVLTCHASFQNRFEDTGLKTAYHSFQAAAGMFTYINENFLHAPSADLSRDTVKTLITLTLAQAQEVFLEKQIADGKKVGLLAKLASQASFLYGQALDGVQENVTKAIFERVWLLVTQIKNNHMSAVAQYYQALADNDANAHGVAICRLQVAENLARDANRFANAFPGTVPVNANLNSETGVILSDITRRHLANVQQKLSEFVKDNDFIYHQPVPQEAALTPIPKLPAAKPIPVSELYQGQDIQKIIGPDIFQRIVPMAVTESASLYDEEKAKLVRAENERIEVANDEMATTFDYLKLPDSLDVLKGIKEQEFAVDEDFQKWCEELAGHAPFGDTFDALNSHKQAIKTMLEECQGRLDQEELVCEKMRNKYGDEWTQQPSSRLTSTMRSDVRNYKAAIDEAATSDARLYSTFRNFENDFDEMRSAGETDEADVLYTRAMIQVGATKGKNRDEGNLLDDDFNGGPSVADQIANVEELMKKLKLVKKEREQVLKDLREKTHSDDISNVLILNKKSIATQDAQIFKAELEKFRPHQNRIIQAIHKQKSLIQELTRAYDALLQDKRVRSEQSKYEAFNRQRSTVLAKYRKVYQAFNDLVTGLMRAQGFYTEMKDTVESLNKNVVVFVDNRRVEGAQVLQQIENASGASSGNPGLVGWERESLNQLMEKMSVNSTDAARKSTGSVSSSNSRPIQSPPLPSAYTPQPPTTNYPSYRPQSVTAGPPRNDFAYNPTSYVPVSPPPNVTAHPPYQQQHRYSQQQQFGSPPPSASLNPPLSMLQQQQAAMAPTGWQPPPPPPGPPPPQGQSSDWGHPHPSGPGGYASGPPPPNNGQQQGGDPWAGLSRW